LQLLAELSAWRVTRRSDDFEVNHRSSAAAAERNGQGLAAVRDFPALFGLMSARGHNPKSTLSALCQLSPTADITLEMLAAAECHNQT